MIFLLEKTYQKGGIFIPIQDFIISLFNLKEEQIDSLSIKRDNDHLIHAYISTVPQQKECPLCRGPLTLYGHGRPKKITHSVLTDQECIIHWTPHRLICKDCGATITEQNPFTYPGFNVSYATIRQIMLDLKKPNLSYKDIAERNHVSITTVIHYFDSYVSVPKPHLPVNLGIDEIHSDMAKYGSAYLCVLYDNTSRQPIDILPSRSKHELSKYFESFPESERNIVRFVTQDMWLPYKDVVRKYLPNAEIAVDPFHVIEHLISCFSRLRINLQHQLEYGSPAYYLLKKWNWLLTASNVDLDNKPVMNHIFDRYMSRRDLLEATLAINDDLSVAYYLMKQYQNFNSTCSQEEAASHLDTLIESFAEADIPAYREFLVLLNDWREEIINSFHTPNGRKQTNALAESINSQIREYLAVSKGNANFERFRRRILYCLNSRIFYSCTSFLTSLKREGQKRGSYKKTTE